MSRPQEFIQTYRPGGKKGVLVERRLYDRLSLYMLTALEESQEITLSALLDRGSENFSDIPQSDFGWYILQIKLDLEARAFIKSYPLPHEKRVMCLKLTRMGAKRLRLSKQNLMAA